MTSDHYKKTEDLNESHIHVLLLPGQKFLQEEGRFLHASLSQGLREEQELAHQSGVILKVVEMLVQPSFDDIEDTQTDHLFLSLTKRPK